MQVINALVKTQHNIWNQLQILGVSWPGIPEWNPHGSRWRWRDKQITASSGWRAVDEEGSKSKVSFYPPCFNARFLRPVCVVCRSQYLHRLTSFDCNSCGGCILYNSAYCVSKSYGPSWLGRRFVLGVRWNCCLYRCVACVFGVPPVHDGSLTHRHVVGMWTKRDVQCTNFRIFMLSFAHKSFFIGALIPHTTACKLQSCTSLSRYAANMP